MCSNKKTLAIIPSTLLLAAMMAFSIMTFSSCVREEAERPDDGIEEVDLTKLPPPSMDPEEEPPPPPPPPPPPEFDPAPPPPPPKPPDFDEGDTISIEEWPEWDTVEEEEIPKENGEPDPNAFILLDKEPVPLNRDEVVEMIGYPPMAREAEIEGKVILRILIDEEGNYKRHIVIRDPHPMLRKAVEKKIDQLKWEPGLWKDKPQSVWVTIPFNFQITD